MKTMNLTQQPSKFGNIAIQLTDKTKGIVLFASETFMNESGRAVKFVLDILGRNSEPDIFVFHDEKLQVLPL